MRSCIKRNFKEQVLTIYLLQMINIVNNSNIQLFFIKTNNQSIILINF